MEVGQDVPFFGPGGGRRPDLRHALQGGFLGNPLAWIGDLGDDPLGRAYPQRIPPQGVLPFGGDATATRSGGVVGVPAIGSGDGGSGPGGGGDVHP